jgi:aminomethyltransferase
MTKQTVLYAAHKALSAQLTDFFGWAMPVHYGSQIEEHLAVRQSAGMFDVSHMTVVDLSGADVEVFLRYLLANNIDKLSDPGRALYTPMLNEQGGIVDDLIVYKREHGYRLVLNAATYEKDIAWLKQQIGTQAVTLDLAGDRLAMISVQGPLAREKVLSCLDDKTAEQVKSLSFFHFIESGDYFIACTGYTGEDGVEIILPANKALSFWQALSAAGVKPCGLGARDTLRLEAGLNLYGADMTEETSPLGSNLAWAVAWQPADRDFIGKPALIAEKAAGTAPKLLGVVLEGKGVLRAGQAIFLNNLKVGEITSGSFSPSLQSGIAFARIFGVPGDLGEVEIRGKRRSVKIVKLPFIRSGQVLI